MPVEEQCVVIFAGTRGYLDGIEVDDVSRFASELLEWFHTRYASVLDEVRTEGKISDEDAYEAAIKAFADQFQRTTIDSDAPDAKDQEDADTSLVTGKRHLPEEDIDRPAGSNED